MSNLLEKASILLTPTGYDNGSMNCIKPNTSVGDFDFTRGSSATRVAENGLIEDVQILGSELYTKPGAPSLIESNFNLIQTGWSFSNGVASIDGSQTSASRIRGGINTTLVAGRKYRVRIGGNITSFRPEFSGGGGSSLASSLNVSGTADFFITATHNHTALSLICSPSGVGSVSSVSIKEVTDNTNLPRIDYSPYTGAGTCGHWLLEPQSTNTATYSNDFSQGDIFNSSGNPSLTNTILTANQGTAPDGTNTAFLLKDNNSGGTGQTGLSYFNTFVDSNDFNTFSVFVKKSLSNNFIYISTGGYDTAASGQSYFNIQDGTLGSVASAHTAKIEDYGSGWYRCSITNKTVTDLQGSFNVNFATSNNSSNITRNGTNGVLLFGVQAEADAAKNFATSYIPTSGSTVTRNKDQATNSGDTSLISSTEGVLYAELRMLDRTSSNFTKPVSIGDGTTSGQNNSVFLVRIQSQEDTFGASIRNPDGSSAFFSLTIPNCDEFFKFAIKYKSGENKMFLNGTEVSTNGLTLALNALDRLNLSNSVGNENAEAEIKSVAVFKEALNNDELECLTGSGFDSFTALAQAGSYTII